MNFANLVFLSFFFLVLFSIGCVVYVYGYRGQSRWEGFSEYVRKGWPVFAPFNCLLYLFTNKRAARPVLDILDFPELSNIVANWELIRDEAMSLQKQGFIGRKCEPDSPAYFDLGFRTFYKYGWSKFYLCWYGYTHDSAKRLCPETVKILSAVPSVKGAMISLLPSNSNLSRHSDPIACSLRFHLGLATPNSSKCFINVDGQAYSWRDGEGFLFDETYLHFAQNESDQSRLILMCDISRPLNILGRIVLFFYSGVTRMTVVPNMEGDKRGVVNLIFSSMSPVLSMVRALKQTNRGLYLSIKYFVNTAIAIAILLVGSSVAVALIWLFTWITRSL